MKRLYSSHNFLVVHHLRNVLEAEGIRAVVKNDLLASAMGELPPAECLAELWVEREVDVARAEQALKKAFQEEPGTPWRCASCGEACEPQFTQCWRCGAYRSK